MENLPIIFAFLHEILQNGRILHNYEAVATRPPEALRDVPYET